MRLNNCPAAAPFLLHSCGPQGRAGCCRQEEEKRQDGDELKKHGHGPEPHIVPREAPNLSLLFVLGQPPQLKPAVVRQLADSGARDDNEGWRSDIRDQVQGEEDDELDDLNDAPGLIDGRARGLAQHLDGVWRVDEEEPMWRDEVLEAELDHGGLRRSWLATTMWLSFTGLTQRPSTHIEHVDSALIHKEALKEPLDYDKAFAEGQDDGVDPGSPAVEDGEKGILRKEGKGEENEVDDEGDEGQRKQPTDEEGPELADGDKVVDAAERIRGADGSAPCVRGPRAGSRAGSRIDADWDCAVHGSEMRIEHLCLWGPRGRERREEEQEEKEQEEKEQEEQEEQEELGC